MFLRPSDQSLKHTSSSSKVAGNIRGGCSRTARPRCGTQVCLEERVSAPLVPEIPLCTCDIDERKVLGTLTKRVTFLMRQLDATSGLALAMARLARALGEAGHEVDVLYGAGDLVGESWPLSAVRLLRSPSLLTGETGPPHVLGRRLGEADLLITSIVDLPVLRLAASSAPTIVYALEHSLGCPEGSKYWSLIHRPCHVRSGAVCYLARPTLGCGDVRHSLQAAPVRTQQTRQSFVRDHDVGIFACSTAQRALLMHDGYDSDRVAVLPPLGMRLTADELGDAAGQVALGERDAILFVGRLTREKGADLLPALCLEPTLGRLLRIYGEGYLRDRLSKSLSHALMGTVSQQEVAGRLLWSRGLIFPSFWPEPGGIVGIDATLAGVPVAIQPVGAALDWPDAYVVNFRRRRTVERWAEALTETTAPRSPEIVADRQRWYWTRVTERATNLIDQAVSGRPWSVPDAIWPRGESW